MTHSRAASGPLERESKEERDRGLKARKGFCWLCRQEKNVDGMDAQMVNESLDVEGGGEGGGGGKRDGKKG